MTLLLTSLVSLLSAAQTVPSDEEARTTAERIVSSVVREGGTWVDENLDLRPRLGLALKDAPGTEAMKAGYLAGTAQGPKVGQGLSRMVGNRGTYTFLRLRKVEGLTRALFRLLPEEGFNYHEFLLEKGADGVVRPADLFYHTTGEYLSGMLMRLYLTTPGVRKSDDKAEYDQDLIKLGRINELRKEGKEAEAMTVYESLSATAKSQKNNRILRVSVASRLSGAAAVEAWNDLAKAFPGEPAVSLLGIDVHLLAKQYEKALAAVDDVDRLIGGDPYLHCTRASIHRQAGASDRAKASALKAIELERTLDRAYWILIVMSLQDGKFDETARWMTAMEKDTTVRFGDLSDTPDFRAFLGSPEGRRWLESRR